MSDPDKPTLDQLNQTVLAKVSPNWYDFGLQLLSPKHVDMLHTIRQNNPKDTETCCAEMFKLWLKDSTATWTKLVCALKSPSVGQYTLAAEIEKRFVPDPAIPTLKQLINTVRPKVAPKWFDIGVELLSVEHVPKLNIIKNNNPGDIETCCTEMFKYWLQVDITANWMKLVDALRSLEKVTLADQIEKLFLQGQVHQISEESEAPAESEEAIMDDDQLMQNIVTMEEVTKELQKSWMDLKMSITKLALINEERGAEITLASTQVNTNDSHHDVVLINIAQELKEWCLVAQQVEVNLSEQVNYLKIELSKKTNSLSTLEKELKEAENQLSNYKAKANKLEDDLSETDSKLYLREVEYTKVKEYSKKLENQFQQLKKEKHDEINQLSEELSEKRSELESYIESYDKLSKRLEFGDSLIISSKDVHMLDELGSGSYSVVYAVEYCGKQCAVKKTKVHSEKSKRSLDRESKVLLNLKHPCVIQLIGIYITTDGPVLLMERMKTSLTHFLEEKHSTNINLKFSILHDVASGLCYIHKKGIIHCDLTGNNILLTESCTAKIADFGQAIIYDQEYDKGLPTAPGNEAHMPPEAFKSNPDYSTKLDVFSFGCVIIHTVTRQFPIPGLEYAKTAEATYVKISQIDRRTKLILALKCTPGAEILHDVVLKCLNDNPDYRPNMDELLLQMEVKDVAISSQCDSDVEENQPDYFKLKSTLKHLEREKLNLQAERNIFFEEKEQFVLELYERNMVKGQLVMTKQLNNEKLEGTKSDTSHQDSNFSRKKISEGAALQSQLDNLLREPENDHVKLEEKYQHLREAFGILLTRVINTHPELLEHQ